MELTLIKTKTNPTLIPDECPKCNACIRSTTTTSPVVSILTNKAYLSYSTILWRQILLLIYILQYFSSSALDTASANLLNSSRLWGLLTVAAVSSLSSRTLSSSISWFTRLQMYKYAQEIQILRIDKFDFFLSKSIKVVRVVFQATMDNQKVHYTYLCQHTITFSLPVTVRNNARALSPLWLFRLISCFSMHFKVGL